MTGGLGVSRLERAGFRDVTVFIDLPGVIPTETGPDRSLGFQCSRYRSKRLTVQILGKIPELCSILHFFCSGDVRAGGGTGSHSPFRRGAATDSVPSVLVPLAVAGESMVRRTTFQLRRVRGTIWERTVAIPRSFHRPHSKCGNRGSSQTRGERSMIASDRSQSTQIHGL